jgi:hypothetical protein
MDLSLCISHRLYMFLFTLLLNVNDVRAVRFNKVPNIKPELVGRRSRPTNYLKSGMLRYLFACPLVLFSNILGCGFFAVS